MYKQNKTIKFEFKKVYQFLGGRTLFWISIGIVAGIVAALVEYLNAMFIQLFLSNLGLLDSAKLPSYFPQALINDLGLVVTTYIFVAFLKPAATFWQSYSPYVFQEILSSRLKILTSYEILLSRKNKSTSEVFFQFSEIFPKAGNYLFYVSLAAVFFVQIILLLSGMVIVCWKETLLGLIGIVIIGLIVQFISQKILIVSSQIPVIQNRIFKSFERVCRNWLLVYVHGTRKQEHLKLTYEIKLGFFHIIRAYLYTVFNGNHPSFLGAGLIAIIILVSQAYFQTPSSTLLIFIYLFIRFVQSLSVLVSTYSQAIAVYPQFCRAYEAFKELSEDTLRNNNDLDKNFKITGMKRESPDSFLLRHDEQQRVFKPKIEVKNVDFSWNDRELFRNFSFTISPGKTVGVIGESGAGKSTLVQLILGVINPRSGKILIDNLTPDEFVSRYSRYIGYVGADPFLFEGTLLENICYGWDQIPDLNDIYDALEKAQLLEFVKSLSGGLEYRLAENGEGLSSGQKQRVALTRAFLRKPALLILDEASANLDLKTEEEIEKTIQKFKGECTTIIISHREGILKNVDEILRLSVRN